MKKTFIPALPDTWLVVEDTTPGPYSASPIAVVGWMYAEGTGVGDLLVIEPLTGELVREQVSLEGEHTFHIRVGFSDAAALAQICTRS